MLGQLAFAVPEGDAPGDDGTEPVEVFDRNCDAGPAAEHAAGFEVAGKGFDLAGGNFGATNFKFEFWFLKFSPFPLNVKTHAGAEFGMRLEMGLVGVAFEEARMQSVFAVLIEKMREDFDDATFGGVRRQDES